MSRINLTKLLKDSGASLPFIAKQLFPENKFPLASLKRVMRGDALLDSEQIAKLATYLDTPIESLYEETWKAEASTDDSITFTKAGYRVILNLDTFQARIYNEETFETNLILTSRAITLSEFFAKVENIIKPKK